MDCLLYTSDAGYLCSQGKDLYEAWRGDSKSMGNHMKLSIIAEGVETEQQKVMLQGFGCNKAQGYFYARPMREAEYTELLRKEKAEN